MVPPGLCYLSTSLDFQVAAHRFDGGYTSDMKTQLKALLAAKQPGAIGYNGGVRFHSVFVLAHVLLAEFIDMLLCAGAGHLGESCPLVGNGG